MTWFLLVVVAIIVLAYGIKLLAWIASSVAEVWRDRYSDAAQEHRRRQAEWEKVRQQDPEGAAEIDRYVEGLDEHH